jgi:hypothetical protein
MAENSVALLEADPEVVSHDEDFHRWAGLLADLSLLTLEV